MAKSKTGSFWLSETVQLPASTANGGRIQGTLDLGSMVDVGDQQAFAVEQVDFIWQRDSDFGTALANFLAGDGSLGVQVTDLNPGTVFVRADDNSLIASGSMSIDQSAGLASESADFYPDNFGKLDESRMVVNDQLYIVIGNDKSAVGSGILYATVRVKGRIVKLGTKDWMSIAIASTAADN
jgi:hypothetical protein